MSTARSTRTVDAAAERERVRWGHRSTRAGADPAEGVPIKDRDACWTVFVIDPVAVPLATVVARVGVLTPNLLTACSVLVSFGAAAAFAFDQLLLGALIYQAAFLVDCLDGKVAAIRHLKSPWGGFFDVTGDTLRFVACFLALALVTTSGHADTWHLLPVLLYPCARFGLLGMAEARPAGEGSRGTMTVEPRPWKVLRLAPRRATKPGSTVDAEAVALTLGPIAHLTTLCFALAAALHVMHAAVVFASSVRQSVGAAR
jgi:phosphatidylglycerophosphate synthase